jgi:hypothetical protein
MHTEHLQNVRASRVLAGWLVAIAVSSFAALVLLALGLLTRGLFISTLWSLVCVLIGFWAGGFFAGFRALEAPILHGIAIGLITLAAWAVINAIAALVLPDTEWQRLTVAGAVGVMFVQMAAAVVGALMGYNTALRGKPGLSEHEPLTD